MSFIGWAQRLYQSWLPWTCVVTLFCWAEYVYLFNFYPPIGLYIGILAFITTIVTFLPPNNLLAKAGWSFVFLALLIFEIRNLYRDRAQHDKEQAEVRLQELTKFKEIADGIHTAITNSQHQFDQTISRVENVSKLANKSISTITGGNSFCYMSFWDNDTRLTLNHGRPVFTSSGGMPLYEVQAVITDQTKLHELTKQQDFVRSVDNTNSVRLVVDIGNIPANMDRDEDREIYFNAPPAKQKFLIQFSARNGSWIELLRLVRQNDRWIKALKVYQNNKQETFIYECIPKSFPLSELEWKPTKNSCRN